MQRGEEHVRETLAKRLVPPELTAALLGAESSVTNALSGLEIALQSFDPTLASALESSRRKIAFQFSLAS